MLLTTNNTRRVGLGGGAGRANGNGALIASWKDMENMNSPANIYAAVSGKNMKVMNDSSIIFPVADDILKNKVNAKFAFYGEQKSKIVVKKR